MIPEPEQHHPWQMFTQMMDTHFNTGGDMMKIDPMMDLTDMEQARRIERFLEDVAKQAREKRHEDTGKVAPRRANTVLVEVDPFALPYLYAYAARHVAVLASRVAVRAESE